MVSSRPEAEWDDTERAWMLGLAAYEQSNICPLCGSPSDLCQAPEAENLAEAGVPVRCHVTTARMRRQEEYKEAKYSGALLWPAGLRQSAQRGSSGETPSREQ